MAKSRPPYDREVLARISQELSIELSSIYGGLQEAVDPDEPALATFAGMPPLVQLMHFRKALAEFGKTFAPQEPEAEPVDDAPSAESDTEEPDEEE